MEYFTGELNHNLFFKFNKRIVTDGIWAQLPYPARAIFPVIGIHCNRNGTAFPGQDRIAAFSNVSLRGVHEGIKALEGARLLEVQRKINSRGKRQNIYKPHIPCNDGNPTFFFHHPIVLGGNWRLLSKYAKSLYCAMRAFSYFSFEYVEDDPYEEYVLRNYEYCQAEEDVLWEMAGIPEIKYKQSLKDLMDKGLLKDDEEEGYPRIYFRPVHVYKVDWLNQVCSDKNI